MPPEGAGARAAANDEVGRRRRPRPPCWPALTLAKWNKALKHAALVAAGPGATPLVHVGDRLYLRRYWQYEQSVSDAIAQRVAMPTPSLRRPRRRSAWPKRWTRCFEPRLRATGPRPPTGRRSRVLSRSAIVRHHHWRSRHRQDHDGRAPAGAVAGAADPAAGRLRIRLAAPTGKAAARLKESIARRSRTAGDVTACARPFPPRPRPCTAARQPARYPRTSGTTRGNPLPLDLLVVDEASMIDLEMMARLLARCRRRPA